MAPNQVHQISRYLRRVAGVGAHEPLHELARPDDLGDQEVDDRSSKLVAHYRVEHIALKPCRTVAPDFTHDPTVRIVRLEDLAKVAAEVEPQLVCRVHSPTAQIELLIPILGHSQ